MSRPRALDQLVEELCRLPGIGEKTAQRLAFFILRSPKVRAERLAQMRALTYNDLSADRNTVAIVQALEALLERHAAGRPGCVVEVNGPVGGLVLSMPGQTEAVVLYPQPV